MMSDGLVWIGAAAGFGGDRDDASIPIVEMLKSKSGPRFLIFETLAERTLALSAIRKSEDPQAGYSVSLDRFLRPILKQCVEEGIRIVGNFGASNPQAAANRIQFLAREANCPTPRIAVVTGDDLLNVYSLKELAACETGSTTLASAMAEGRQLISANAYLGCQSIVAALDAGADIVVTGRVADPSLFLGPLVHAHHWEPDDWDRMAAGTLAGHLLECGSQVTGGYFADPGNGTGASNVDRIDKLGYPVACVSGDGVFHITKPEGTGGRVDRHTVTAQMLYEIHDPAAYITPDVVLDITGVDLEELSCDAVKVKGAAGRARPDRLKATVCVDGGLLAEAEISYAGGNAAGRASLAAEIVQKRMQRRLPELRLRVDLIGLSSILQSDAGGWSQQSTDPDTIGDVRVRFAAHGHVRDDLQQLLDEVEALYCAGPAGGAGVRGMIKRRVVSTSCMVECGRVHSSFEMFGGEMFGRVT
jgi:hypothetical protein